jgi:SAM-dependent methyltransferase
MGADLTARRWDDEYRTGRYGDEPPVPFVQTILSTLRDHAIVRDGVGLYVGCGNGRNYLPLLDAGLTLYGVDVSPEAIRQLAARRPAHRPRLVCADFRRLDIGTTFSYLVAIQVFQHGGEEDASAYFARAWRLLSPGGLLFVRVNAAATDVFHRHTVVERNPLGGYTVRYEEGPKRDLLVHFYSREELLERTKGRFSPLVEPREDVIPRSPPKTGCWVQFEAVWKRRGDGDE